MLISKTGHSIFGMVLPKYLSAIFPFLVSYLVSSEVCGGVKVTIRFIMTGILTIGPIVAILFWLYRMDANREPFGKVMKTFGLGVACTIPAVIFALPFFVFGHLIISPLARAFLMAFFAAAIPEEFAKLLVIRFYSARLPSFDEPMDGIVYGVVVALGFAALENVLYVSTGTLTTAVMRAFTAVPAHAIEGGMIGYAISRAMFVPGSRSRTWIGYVAAVLLHGLYNFGLLAVSFAESPSGGFNAFYWLPLGTLILGVLWVRRTTHQLRSEQLIAISGGGTTQATSKPSFLSQLKAGDPERHSDTQD